jgi:hypothetical protein
MEELTLNAGVPPSQWDEVTKHEPDLISSVLQERLLFLIEVRQNQFDSLLKVWKLVPVSAWAMYKMLGQKKLEEQKLLREKQKALRKVWKERYGRA